MKNLNTLFLGVASQLVPGLAWAQTNGEMTWEQLDVHLLHKADEDFAELDSDRDGILTADQKIAYAEIKLESLRNSVADTKSDIRSEVVGPQGDPSQTTYTQSDIDAASPPSKKGISKPWQGVQIARSFDGIDPWLPDLTDAKYAARLKGTEGAIFSYFSIDGGGQGIEAQGVIAKPFVSQSGQFSIIPGLEFNKLETDKVGGTELDSLRLKTALAFKNYNEPNSAKQYEVILGAVYGTDFDFKTSSRMLEVDLTTNGFEQGSFFDLGNLPSRMRYRLFAHAEYGGGLDDASLKESDFFRVGPRANLDVVPAFPDTSSLSWLNDRLLLSANYGYYWNLDSGLDYELLRSSLNWRLDEWGHLNLKVEFENGYLPLSGKRHEQFSVGIGLVY